MITDFVTLNKFLRSLTPPLEHSQASYWHHSSEIWVTITLRKKNQHPGDSVSDQGTVIAAAGRPGTRRPPGDRRRDVPLPGVSGGGRLAAEGLGSPGGVVKALAGTGTAGGMTYWAKCGQIRAHSGRSGESSQGRGTREMGRVLGTGQRVWREVSAGDGDKQDF